MPTHLLPVRVRSIALILAAALLAAAGMAVVAARSTTSNADAAATTGSVHILMKVTGHNTGVFKGDSPQKNRADQIVVLGYQFEVDSPRDASSGQATGKRQYKPIVVTHELDGASPQFVKAAAINELLSSVVIDFFRVDKTGKEVNFYRVTLTNGGVASVKQYSSGATVLEDDSLAFQTITQEDLIAKTTFTDNWQSVI
jgi:type VI secretion system secreted protein Hcp